MYIFKVNKPISVDTGRAFALYEGDMFEFFNNEITKLIYYKNGRKNELVLTVNRSNLIYYKSWVSINAVVKLGIIDDITLQYNRDKIIDKIIDE